MELPLKPVCAYGAVITTPVTLNDVLPVFVIVKACGAAGVPSAWLPKFRDVALNVAMAVVLLPMPFSVIFCDGSPLKLNVIVPV